jgi:uncharacterized membrane protein YqaE (UPF0057 family)
MPPLVALAVATVVGSVWPHAGSTGLLLAAASGYAVGALWLLPACNLEAPIAGATDWVLPEPMQADSRSTALRLAHTSADALTGVAIILVWQRSHGAADAGYLAVLLRVLGFMPTMVHAAWAQVLLVQRTSHQAPPLLIGLAGALATGFLGLACATAVQMHWLAASWAGLLPYVLPLVLWQAGACLFAACSHLPFQQGRARAFSNFAIPASTHAWWLGCVSAVGLLGLSLGFALRGSSSV